MMNQIINRGNLTKLVKQFENKFAVATKKEHQQYLYSGPAYANGIHHGTIFNLVLKDATCKLHRSFNIDLGLIIGSDMHGIPIAQKILSKQTNLFIKKLQSNNINEILIFNNKCREYANFWFAEQKKFFSKLGIEYSFEYTTNDINYIKHELKILQELIKLKYVQNDTKHVNFCQTCKTFLSLAEQETITHIKEDLFLFFNTKCQRKILVWTTTPYSLLENQGIAFNPNLNYVEFELNQKIYIASENYYNKINDSNKQFISILSSDILSKIKYIHPFNNEELQLYSSELVESTKGTGFLHLVAFYSEVDYKILKDNNKEVNYILNEDFTIGEQKLNINQLNKIVKQKLQNIFEWNQIYGDINVCWRCKNPTYKCITNQLFLIFNHENKLLITNMLKKINVFPSKNNYLIKLFENRPPWCLTRQKYWGVFIPLLKCKNCKILIYNEEVYNNYLDNLKTESSWLSFKIKKYYCEKCNQLLIKLYNVIDVWFDSACVHNYITNNLINKENKCSILIEGEDQQKAWFQVSSIINSCIGENLTNNIVIHPYIIDKQKKKLSKSSLNYQNIDEFLNDLPGDAARILFLSSDLDKNLVIDEENIRQAKQNYIIIKNHLQYIYNKSLEFSSNNLNNIEKNYLSLVTTYLDNAFKNYLQDFNISGVTKQVFKLIKMNNYFLELYKKGNLKTKFFLALLTILLKKLKFLIPFTIENFMVNFNYCEINYNNNNIFNEFFYRFFDKKNIKFFNNYIELKIPKSLSEFEIEFITILKSLYKYQVIVKYE